MRSNLSPEHFFKKMKKKPALQAILDNLDDYTEADLAEIPGQPLWIRQVLVTLKKNNGEYSLSPYEIAAQMTASAPASQTQTFDMYMWEGESNWIGHELRATKFQIEVEHGDPILVLTPEKIMLGSTAVEVDSKSMSLIANNSQYVDKVDKIDYLDRARELRNRKLRT